MTFLMFTYFWNWYLTEQGKLILLTISMNLKIILNF